MFSRTSQIERKYKRDLSSMRNPLFKINNTKQQQQNKERKNKQETYATKRTNAPTACGDKMLIYNITNYTRHRNVYRYRVVKCIEIKQNTTTTKKT